MCPPGCVGQESGHMKLEVTSLPVSLFTCEIKAWICLGLTPLADVFLGVGNHETAREPRGGGAYPLPMGGGVRGHSVAGCVKAVGSYGSVALLSFRSRESALQNPHL